MPISCAGRAKEQVAASIAQSTIVPEGGAHERWAIPLVGCIMPMLLRDVLLSGLPICITTLETSSFQNKSQIHHFLAICPISSGLNHLPAFDKQPVLDQLGLGKIA